MIAIVPAISNLAPAPPGACSGGQSIAGGFALKLVAAQGAPAPRQTPGDDVGAPNPAQKAAGSVANSGVRPQVAGGSQLKKGFGNFPGKTAGNLITNMVVPALSATETTPAPALSSLPGSLQPQLSESNLLPPSVLSPDVSPANPLPPNLPVANPAETVSSPNRAPRTPFQQQSRAVVEPWAKLADEALDSLPNLKPANINSLGSVASSVPIPALSGVAKLPSNAPVGTAWPLFSTATATSGLGVAVAPQSNSSASSSDRQNATSPLEAKLEEPTPPGVTSAGGEKVSSELSVSTRTATASPLSSNQFGAGPTELIDGIGMQPGLNSAATQTGPDALSQSAAAKIRAIVPALDEAQAAESATIPAIDLTIASAIQEPVLSADARNGGAPLPPANSQSSQSNSRAIVSMDVADQSDFSSQTATDNSFSAVSAQFASLVSPAPQQSVAEKMPMQFAALKASRLMAPTNARTSSLPAPNPSSTATAGTGVSDGARTDQTPFSVFFSTPGPGTESAASALPKMILPSGGSAAKDHRLPVAGWNAGSQNGGTQNGGAQNAATHNIAPQSGKPGEAPSVGAATESGSGDSQAGPPSKRGTEGSTAASAPQAVAATTTGTAALSAGSAAVTLPLSATSVPIVDLLAKAGTLPGSEAGPANLAPPAPETPTAPLPGPVQMAQLVSRVEQSEMRIGMTTSAFGSVEVRAVVHASDVGLVVGSEKGDLRTLLANDMPAIANNLQEQNLRLHSVNFMQGFAFSNNASGGGESQQRFFAPPRTAVHAGLSDAAAEETKQTMPVWYSGGISGGLSILA